MYVRRPFQWYKVCWFWWENVHERMNDEEHGWTLGFFQKMRFDPYFRCLHGVKCFWTCNWTTCPGPYSSARSYLKVASLRSRSSAFPLWLGIFFFICYTCFIYFIHSFFNFSSNWKNHNFKNNKPNWLGFFVPWSLQCPLFYEYFSRICACVDIKIA